MERCRLLALMLFIYCSGVIAVPPGYQQVAQQQKVPAEALYSLALTESAVQLPQGLRPWAWTLNVAGQGYYYPTRQQAWLALQIFMRDHSLKKIDVGIAQINLGWNGHRFNSTWEALEPYTNLAVAAQILRECYDKKTGSWLDALGCYHHPAGGKLARRYQSNVNQHLQSLQHSTPSTLIWLDLMSEAK